jgi:hypothetical protein
VPTPAPPQEDLFTLAKKIRALIEYLKEIDWTALLIALFVGLIVLAVLICVVCACCSAFLKEGFRGLRKGVHKGVHTVVHGRKRRRVHINGRWRDHFDEDSVGLYLFPTANLDTVYPLTFHASDTLESGSFADPRQYSDDDDFSL